jgi:CRP-like cAMP-binding protein
MTRRPAGRDSKGEWELALDDESANSLDKIELLSVLTPQVRGEVARLCSWRRYGPHEQIIDRQSETREVLFVVSGKVRIVIYSVTGRELTLDDLNEGAFFGELSAIDGSPRSASVMALTDTVIAALSADHFRRLLGEQPDFAYVVMRRLAAMVRASTDRIIDLSTLGANNRVHAELLRQARVAGADENGVAELKPIPVHGDIAARVSTTRETVARVLNDLARQGLLRRERDALVVLDVDELQYMVDEVRGE